MRPSMIPYPDIDGNPLQKLIYQITKNGRIRGAWSPFVKRLWSTAGMDDLIIRRDGMVSAMVDSGYSRSEQDRIGLDKFVCGSYSNLAVYSLRARDWTMVSGATAQANMLASPWGRDRADQIIMAADAADGISQAITVSDGDSINISCYAKLATGTGALRFASSADGGTVSDNIAISATWARISWTVAITTGGSITFSIINGSGAAAQSPYVWGIQVTKSKFMLPLVFGSNLNKVSNPMAFENAAWTKTDLTADDDGGAVGIDARVGVATSRLAATANSASVAGNTFAVAAGDVVQICATMRRHAGNTTSLLMFGDNVTNYYAVIVDWTAGTLTYDSGDNTTLVASEMIPVGDGWYKIRLRIYFKVAVAAAFVQFTFGTDEDIFDIDVLYGYIMSNVETLLDLPLDPVVDANLVYQYDYDENDKIDDLVAAGYEITGNPTIENREYGNSLKIINTDKVKSPVINGINGSSDFTLAFRIKCEDSTTGTHLVEVIGKSSSPAVSDSFYLTQYGVYLYIYFATAFPLTSIGMFPTNGFKHVLITRVGTTLKRYLNGVLVGSVTGANNIENTLYKHTGGNSGNTSWLREELLYNRAVSDAEAIQIHCRPFVTARTLSYSESIAAESSAYASPDCNVSFSGVVPVNNQVGLVAVWENNRDVSDSREDGTLVSWHDDDGDPCASIYLDQSGDVICGQVFGNDPLTSSIGCENGDIVAAVFMSGDAAAGVTGSRLYVVSPDGESDDTDDLGAGVADLSEISFGAKVAAGSGSLHADCPFYFGAAFEIPDGIDIDGADGLDYARRVAQAAYRLAFAVKYNR